MFARAALKKMAVHSAAQRGFKVAVIGSSGGIGQPLSLLMKLNQTGLVTKLSLYDLAGSAGVAADLEDIPTSVKVEGFSGEENLPAALKDADVVLVPAGMPRKPGMTRDDLFTVNATINANLATACAKHCPNASFLVISNPVNSTVPIWAKTLEKFGVFNPNKLYGVTTLDIFRANARASERTGKATNVVCVGAHAGETIVTLPSLASVDLKFNEQETAEYMHNISFGGDRVVKAKNGTGSATLSMAAAGAKFAESVLQGLAGHTVINEIAYVRNPLAESQFGTKYFATQIDIGKNGISAIHDTVAKANEFEQAKINAMIPDLKAQIAKGEAFAETFSPAV